MAEKFKKFIQNYLSKKISAEIKSCLTFLLMLCFYCIYKWICGIKEVSIIHMLEIVCTAYVLEWIQILLHFDFEDIEKMLQIAKKYMTRENPRTRILGAHLEGPWLSLKNKGAQHESFLRRPQQADLDFILK